MKAKLFHFKCSNKWINEKVLLQKCICFRVWDNLLFLPEKPERASGYSIRATKSRLIRKDPDVGKDWRQEEKGMTEDEIVGWHYQFEGHEFEQALGVGDGQGSLVCCSPRGCKELDTTVRLNSWTTKDLRKATAEFWQSHQRRRHHLEETLAKTKDYQMLHHAWYSSAWSQQDTPANHERSLC